MKTRFNQLAQGVWEYENIFPEALGIVNRLEEILKDKNNSYIWKQAAASESYRDLILSYRDCYDFKFKKEIVSFNKNEHWLKMDKVWDDCMNSMQPAIEEYCNNFKIKLNYIEAFNFVKYGEGQHFSEHSDHGESYVSTLSAVGYLNDNYTGGELFFPHFNLFIKPKPGSLILFPSSYIYSHKAMPVKDGTKYSLVTMLDYNNKYHGGS
jgi:hypothetical protein